MGLDLWHFPAPSLYPKVLYYALLFTHAHVHIPTPVGGSKVNVPTEGRLFYQCWAHCYKTNVCNHLSIETFEVFTLRSHQTRWLYHMIRLHTKSLLIHFVALLRIERQGLSCDNFGCSTLSCDSWHLSWNNWTFQVISCLVAQEEPIRVKNGCNAGVGRRPNTAPAGDLGTHQAHSTSVG